MKISTPQYTIDTDDVAPAIDTINRLKRFEGEIGIFDPEVSKYAAKMEYGTTNKDGTVTPPRSFLRSTVNETSNKVVEHMAERVKEVFFERGAASAPTFHKIQEIFEEGSKILELAMVEKIWNNIPPPLSQRRLKEKKAKESPFPEIALIDTGRMIGSITHRIIRKN